MIVLILIFLGLCIGSFLNAFVWRWYEKSETKSKKRRAKLSITKGRSMCPNCSHVLNTWDLLPVASWIGLRGKCRYCKRRISIQYPIVELSTMLLFIVSYLAWPYGFELAGGILFAGWLIILSGFIALAIYDFRWMLLPTKIVYALFTVAAITITAYLYASSAAASVYLLATVSSILIGGLFFSLHMLSDGRWIGGGDVRLGYVLGLIVMAPTRALGVIFLASLLGTLYAVPHIIKGNKNAHIPFGPFLMAGATIIFLFGDKLLSVLVVQ